MYSELTSLGHFYPLNINFDPKALNSELTLLSDGWRHYNPSKPHIPRQGLSLFSLDGGTGGEIDLNSLREYNILNPQNKVNEMSFRTPTPHWQALPSLSSKLKDLEPYLGRSHLIRFAAGGFFPPHRDLGNSFRLISFFDCSSDYFFVILDGVKIHFTTNILYFMDTKLTHSIFSTTEDAKILVLNVEISSDAIQFVGKNLRDI